jgi:uncharacterized protein (TIGR02145 family)
LDETNETVIVTLSSPSNATLGDNTVHTHTIEDDDDTAPVFTSGATATAIAENGSDGALVYTAIATDVDTTTLVYGLSGSDMDFFEINTDGAVTIKAAADFETKPSYSFNVTAFDGDMTTAQAVTLAVTDVVEAVVMTVDGQTYSTVEIGNQIWTASNVSIVPRDSNGPMNEGNPLSGSNSVWEGANGEPGEYYTHYWGSGGEAADEDGYYYTWAAAQNVCPTGWRLPSDQDWQNLERELGVIEQRLTRGAGWFAETRVAYTKLLAGGTSGFNAKLAGYPHQQRGSYAYFWSSDQYIYRQLRANGEYVSRASGQHITHPRSVRCLKNN